MRHLGTVLLCLILTGCAERTAVPPSSPCNFTNDDLRSAQTITLNEITESGEGNRFFKAVVNEASVLLLTVNNLSPYVSFSAFGLSEDEFYFSDSTEEFSTNQTYQFEVDPGPIYVRLQTFFQSPNCPKFTFSLERL